MSHRRNRIISLCLLACTATVVQAADELPQTTPEGMELRKQTKSRIVYAMPGADLAVYSRVALLDCYVAFEKNWERDYNRDVSLDRRIRTSDMERIKSDLAAEFREIFTKALTDAGHEVVDTVGPDVLVVRPALIDLEVNAPDVQSAGFDRVIVQSAGSMKLYMELYDSETSAIIARVMDAQADRAGLARQATRPSNKMAADRILRGWATELAGHLGDVKEDTPAADE